MSEVAYAPKAGREDPDHFGVIYVNDLKTINVREALEAGNGYVITGDPEEQRALDTVESLKHVTIAEARGEMPKEVADSPVVDDLKDRTKEELLALDEANDISAAKTMKVDDLRDAIRRTRTDKEA